MSFCILRTKKLSTFGQVVSSAKHTFREVFTPNVDYARTHMNTTRGAQSSGELLDALKRALPARRRKDAVVCIEYLFSASREWFDEVPRSTQDDFLNATITWLDERHQAHNVLCVNIQEDETSRHLVAYVVPMTPDNRLCAKSFLGGRACLAAMQNHFAKVVGAPFGLRRGIEGAKAMHTTNKAYNAALTRNPELIPPQRPRTTLVQRLTGEAATMEAKFNSEFETYVRLVEQARNVTLLGQRGNQKRNKRLEQLHANAEDANRWETIARERLDEVRRLEKIIVDKEEDRASAARTVADALGVKEEAEKKAETARLALVQALKISQALAREIDQIRNESQNGPIAPDLPDDSADGPTSEH